MADTMDLNFEEIKKSIWHAYSVLGEQPTGSVSRSKLKVLTHNLANTVGIEGVEELLPEQSDDATMNFNDYLDFLQTNVFDVLKKRHEDPENMVGSPASPDTLNDVCWMLCSKSFRSRAGLVLRDADTKKMWTVFNFLVEPSDKDDKLAIPLRIDVEEARYVFRRFADCTGSSWEADTLDAALDDTISLDYITFVQAFEATCLSDLKPPDISRGINDVHDEIVQEVIKKGRMSKKGHMVTNWKERLFVLRPTSLRYYAGNRGIDSKDLRGELQITQDSRVESVNEKQGSKLYRFIFHTTGNKPYEISAPDLKTKNEWVRAIQTAISYASKPGTLQKDAAGGRRQSRKTHRNQLSEEERKRQEELAMIKRQREELEAERQARAQLEEKYAEEERRREEFLNKLKEIERMREEEQGRLEELDKKYQDEMAKRKSNLKNLRELQEMYEQETAAKEAHMKKVQELEDMCQAEESKLQDIEARFREESSQREADLRHLQELENKYQEEAALREMDQQKVKELEEVRRELEHLLEEERNARKDEDVVRCLQARLLDEETDKREELERLHKQQMAMLVVEQQEREGLEEQKSHQDALLEEARQQLEKLEMERKAADEKLMEATAKLHEAESGRVKAQEKARLWSTPIGLARPIQPDPKPWITHRGEGAFIEADFHRNDQVNGFEQPEKRFNTEENTDICESTIASTTEENIDIGEDDKTDDSPPKQR